MKPLIEVNHNPSLTLKQCMIKSRPVQAAVADAGLTYKEWIEYWCLFRI